MHHLGRPLDARPWFGPERARLLELLGGLSAEQWRLPTVCPGWSVGDVAAHLAGDDLGRLARTRDGWSTGPPAEPLPAFLARINEEWVTASRRLGPALVTALLGWTGPQIEALWSGHDPDALGEPVTWAGPEPAPGWLDAARDLSEYWIHRQQILDALGRDDDSPADETALVLGTLVRGLPFALSGYPRPPGTTVTVRVTGPGGGAWTARAGGDGWVLREGAAEGGTRVETGTGTAWRLWTRGIEPHAARLSGSGDGELVTAVREMVSIIR